MKKCLSLGLAVVALALWVGISPAAEEKDSLDSTLKKHAPEIIKHLREHKYQNVGVLKFVVKQGDRSTDNAGPLNLSLANRLEVALVLANPDDKLGLIERASEAVVRARNRRANHLSPEGRAALFRTLAELGRSYHLKSRGPDESELLAQAVDQSRVIEDKKESNPLESGKSPVELRILYNGTAVRPVNGVVPEPLKDDKVTFELINRSEERCGVVLKVNGENTLFREPYEASQCHKWILGPGEKVKVDGFQLGPKESKRFEVLSPEESEKDSVNYGSHAGTFSLVVFRESKADGHVVTASHDTAAISRGSLSPNGKKPGTLEALQAALRDKGSKSQAEGSRGILSAGESIDRPIQYVSFKPDRIPVLSATIRYYQPGR
jgi:hypothetical protein